MTIMLTTGEQQELRQIEQELRDTDRGFAWRLTLLQGMLRWAALAGRLTCWPWPYWRRRCCGSSRRPGGC